VNKVMLTGRLTQEPELRTTAAGKAVVSFTVATSEFEDGNEKHEYHNVIAWDRLAEVCGRYLTKGAKVGIEGRIKTRTWDDDLGKRHWKTEIVAQEVELLGSAKARPFVATGTAQP